MFTQVTVQNGARRIKPFWLYNIYHKAKGIQKKNNNNNEK